MRIFAYIGALLGLTLLVVLLLHSDFPAMLALLGLAGWSLLWLIPYRLLYYLLYALGWRSLLQPYDSQRRAGLGFLLWVTAVRDAIDRLLPAISVGGGVAGVLLLRRRGLGAVPASTTVIVEVLLTLIALYLFTAAGLLLLLDLSANGEFYRHLFDALLLSLPIPLLTAVLLRYGSVFRRLHRLIRPLVGDSALSEGAAALDRELGACLHRGRTLVFAGTLQLIAFVSGSLEVWLALRLFEHPVSARVAVALESMTQAVRHLAFVIPAGLGVQEAGLVLFGHALGISSELALAVSMAKRTREVLCGLPALASWQWLEGRRLHRQLMSKS